MKRVLIAGVSTRAAAESAAQAGLVVTTIDAFGDLDQHASVRSVPLPRKFTAYAAARAARNIECDAVAYLSSFENHPSAVIALVAAAGRAVPLGVSRQLVGEHAFGAAGYRYCGNILAAAGDAQFARDEALVADACALAQAVAEEFGVVGVNGIDFIARDGVPYAIEVNPRWSSSMELVERAYGLSVFGAHAAACEAGA